MECSKSVLTSSTTAQSGACKTINFEAVPEYVRDNLAGATVKAVKAFIATPGGKEFLERRVEERKKRLEAAKKEQKNETRKKLTGACD